MRVEYGASHHRSPALTTLLARLILTVLMLSAAQMPVRAEETRASADQRIEQMVARCNGDKTCELIVRKRETTSAERRLHRAEQDRLLQQSSPFSYYLSLWGRYLLFVLVLCGTAGLYIFVMRRFFGRKK